MPSSSSSCRSTSRSTPRCSTSRSRPRLRSPRRVLLGDEHGVRVEPVTVRARSIGQAIVDQALERDADLIVLGSSPRWRRQSTFFSPTVDYVLGTRPARCSSSRSPRVCSRTYPETMKLVVIGCGRVGAAVSRELAADGWDVTAVDEKEEALVTARAALVGRLRRRPRHGRADPAQGGRPGRRRRRRRDERRQHEPRRRPGGREALGRPVRRRAGARPRAGRLLRGARHADDLSRRRLRSRRSPPPSARRRGRAWR